MDKYAIFGVWLFLVTAYCWFNSWITRRFASIRPPRRDDRHGRLAGLCVVSVPLLWLLSPTLPDPRLFIIGGYLFPAGAALVLWAKWVNPWFTPTLTRPPFVIRRGPYAFCSHPGYLGFGMMAIASVLMLGSLLTVFPVVVYLGLLVGRARFESRILS